MADETQQQPSSSYISKPGRFSPKSLFIQIALLLFVIVVFILGLAYFNLLPTSKLTNLFSTKNTANYPMKGQDLSRVAQITPTPFVIDTTQKGDISAVSDIPTYKITLLQKQALIDLLTSWGVFSIADDLYKSQGKTLPNNITIHLTDKTQALNQTKDTNGAIIVSSSISTSDPKAFSVNIQLGPTILNASSQTSSSYLQSEFLAILYTISHPAKTQADAQKRAQEMSKTLLQITKTDSFFTVEKL